MREKNWFREHWDQLRSAAIGAVLIGAVVFGWYSVRMYQNRKAVEAIITERSQAALEEAAADTGETELMSESVQTQLLAEDTVEYQGKTYRRNSYVKAILCMGVDRSDIMTEEKGFDEAGQADGIFLLAQDTARNALKILMIPRDTMTEISVINPDMSIAGKEISHLTLAYANGDGKEGSCENMVEAVENLFYGFAIDHYLAADTKIISSLNDAAGGVTVTVPTSGMEKRDPSFVKGETITLHGEQAEAFVRYRDIHRDHSALYRMDQQQEYITQYFKAVQDMAREDSQIVSKLFTMIQDYMVTDMGKEVYLKVAMDAITGEGLSKDDFYTVPGNSVTTDMYDEYYPDQQATIPILLRIFYRETE